MKVLKASVIAPMGLYKYLLTRDEFRGCIFEPTPFFSVRKGQIVSFYILVHERAMAKLKTLVPIFTAVMIGPEELDEIDQKWGEPRIFGA